MFVKKFEGSTLEEALSQARKELGPDALVLSTQKGHRGFFQKTCFTLTAAKDNRVESPANNTIDDEKLLEIFPHRKTLPLEKSIRKTNLQRYQDLTPSPKLDVGMSEPMGIKRKLYELGFSEPSVQELMRTLTYEFGEEDLKNPDFFKRSLAKVMVSYIRTLDANIFKVKRNWISIGGAGSGKTSVLVKLGIFLKQKKENLIFVRGDKRKLLGFRELKSYAEAIHVPCIEDPISSHDGIQMEDGPSVGSNEAISPDLGMNKSVLLVIDGCMRLKEALKIIEKLVSVHIDGIVFTRVDMTTNLGALFDVLRFSKLPLLGMTSSSSFKIPIRFFKPREFTDFVLAGS